MTAASASPWYASWFDRDYLRVYAGRDEADAARGVELLARALAPAPGAVVLDLACGAGRHLTHLLERELAAVGLDLSPTLLDEARRETAASAPLVRADMRSLPFAPGSFDAVASFFTSFGYFDDADNALVLHEVARVLRPRGQLYLDLLNREHALESLVPEGRRVVDGIDIHERRWWDPERQRLEKRMELRSARGARSVTESVRLYPRSEIVAMCAAVGLAAEAVFGDLSGTPYHEGASPRLILRAERLSSPPLRGADEARP